MTIRDRAFWLYLLCIIVVGIAIWLTIFTTLYHPGLELSVSSHKCCENLSHEDCENG